MVGEDKKMKKKRAKPANDELHWFGEHERHPILPNKLSRHFKLGSRIKGEGTFDMGQRLERAFLRMKNANMWINHSTLEITVDPRSIWKKAHEPDNHDEPYASISGRIRHEKEHPDLRVMNVHIGANNRVSLGRVLNVFRLTTPHFFPTFGIDALAARTPNEDLVAYLREFYPSSITVSSYKARKEQRDIYRTNAKKGVVDPLYADTKTERKPWFRVFVPIPKE